LIESLLFHDLEPSFVCFGDGLVQVGKVDPDNVPRDIHVDVNVEEISWYRRVGDEHNYVAAPDIANPGRFTAIESAENPPV
jgi:hypothetical protein